MQQATAAQQPATQHQPAVAAIGKCASTAAAVAPVARVVEESASDLVNKYVAIGKALHQRPASPATDALWQRFRLIRINEAIATASGRHDTAIALASIERAIPR